MVVEQRCEQQAVRQPQHDHDFRQDGEHEAQLHASIEKHGKQYELYQS
jgi:hypothetical protein